MNGIIIVNQNIGHNQYKIDRFQDECQKRNIQLDVFINDGTLAEIINGEVKINLPKADFVFYFDKDIYLARLMEKAGYRLFNRADFIKLCDDKMLTFIRCSNLGINMPKTIAGPLVYTDLKEENFKFLDTIIDQLGLPMVVKKVYGSLGEGVYPRYCWKKALSSCEQTIHSGMVSSSEAGTCFFLSSIGFFLDFGWGKAGMVALMRATRESLSSTSSIRKCSLAPGYGERITTSCNLAAPW